MTNISTPTPILLTGPKATLPIAPNDEVAVKLAMLFEGIHRQGALEEITRKYGYRREHFYQVFDAFTKNGSEGLRNKKPGPKANTVRTKQVINQIIRHRFLDPEASAAVIAQKLTQQGMPVTIRSVERTITEYGLQKKTLTGLTPAQRKQLLESSSPSGSEKP